MTDLNNFASVGAYIYAMGKQRINDWLEAHTIHSKAIIYGKSLGGAHAWRTALNFTQQVEKVMA